jgi:hypothetical protein
MCPICRSKLIEGFGSHGGHYEDDTAFWDISPCRLVADRPRLQDYSAQHPGRPPRSDLSYFRMKRGGTKFVNDDTFQGTAVAQSV